ncbi:MAG TPA: AMP-binding protein [Bryobacteraceae bacterium]|nr:AMP-binding protein [Bryobacteraceae bacterium]
MTLNHLFDLTVRTRPREVALEFYDSDKVLRTVSFEEVFLRSRRMVSVLQSRGVRTGDRLCVYLANSVGMIDLYLACVAMGVIFVPINVLYREREIGHILRDCEPMAVIVDGDVPAEGAVLWRLPALLAEASRASAEVALPSLDGDDAAAIIYTSGTTGTSKGAVLTHNNFAVNAINLNACWRIDESDRLLLALPLFHVHGLGNGLHCWLAAGCRLRLLERFDHRQAVDMFLDFRPTVFFGVPTMYVRLLEMPEEPAGEIGGFMRLFVCGSAPLPTQVLEEFNAKFAHIILERYGMTATLMNISNPYVGERRPGAVGLPLPGISVEVRDADGRVLPAGSAGELYVRGPNVFARYWRNPQATRAAFDDRGYFRTGDIGVRSADGYYTLQGRRSDLIISGGFNIYPREIEEFLAGQEGVREAAVAGVPDTIRGEVPVAYLVCDGDVDASALEDRCRSAFASFKIPRAFVRVPALPRTALGKVQKHLLPPVERGIA